MNFWKIFKNEDFTALLGHPVQNIFFAFINKMKICTYEVLGIKIG